MTSVLACAKKNARKELRAVTDMTPRATFQRSTGRIANIQQAPAESRRSRAVLPFGVHLESGRHLDGLPIIIQYY